MKRLLLPLCSFALLFVPAETRSGWGSACFGGGPPSMSSAKVESGYRWENPDSADERIYLLKDGVRVGCWYRDSGGYLAVQGGQWVDAKPPIDPPQKMIGTVSQNFGIDLDKLSKREKYSINGVETDRRRVLEALTGDKSVPDDRNVPRLLVIGEPGECERVQTDLDHAPDLQPFRGKFLVQTARPDHWWLKENGYVTSGRPTIYVLNPDGRTLWRQDGYTAASTLAQGLRKARPDYDPAKDPGPFDPSKLPKEMQLALAVLAVLGILAFMKGGANHA